MAYLLILSGGRVDELVELNPTATLTVGRSPSAHVQIPDAEIAEVHCQVYPAEGRFWMQDLGHARTLHNLRPVVGEISGLSAHDVLVLGDTFLKFVTERPTAAAGDDGNAAKVQQLQSELSASRGELSKAEKAAEALRDALAGRETALDAIRKRAETTRLEAERLRLATETRLAESQRELAELRSRLEEAARQLEGAQADLGRVKSPALVFGRLDEEQKIRDELTALRARASSLHRGTDNTVEAAGES